MKKYITLLLCAAAMLAGCTKEDSKVLENSVVAEGDGVAVSIGLGLPDIISGVGTEPMSRGPHDGQKLTLLNNQYKALVIKHIVDESVNMWVVDTLLQPCLSKDISASSSIYITTETVFDNFDMVLRPGDYRVLVIVNDEAATWNDELIPGTIVQDENDLSVILPAALTYSYIDDAYKCEDWDVSGSREIYAGIQDFTVVKQQELSTPGDATIISVSLTRRTARFAVWLKDTPEYNSNFRFDRGTNQVWFNMKAIDPIGFCQGIDVFGEPYYSGTPMTELHSATRYTKYFVTTLDGDEKYAIPYVGKPLYSSHFFIDSDLEDGTPYNLIKIVIEPYQGGGSGQYNRNGYTTSNISIKRFLKNREYDAVGVFPTRNTEHGTWKVILDFDKDLGTGEILNISRKMSKYVDWNL